MMYVHLMIDNPDRCLEDFARAGSTLMTVQVEACVHLHRTVQAIRALDVKDGVAVNPATPVSAIDMDPGRCGRGSYHQRKLGLWRSGIHSKALRKISDLKSVIGGGETGHNN